MQTRGWMRLHERDNVAVRVAEAAAPVGEALEPGPPDAAVILKASIPRGHKVALTPIAKGQAVVKFAQLIGVATSDIAPGEHVHTHNLAMPPAETITSLSPELPANRTSGPLKPELPQTFQGFARESGRAGVRNYVVVAATVNCSATVVKAICRHFLGRDLGQKELHGVIPVSHASGCAQAIGGLGYEVLNRTLAGWLFHPNVVGAVVIGLGCEGTTLKSILASKQAAGRKGDLLLEQLNIQDVGGTAEAIAQGIAAVERLLVKLPRFHRTELPVSHLNLALNCGGSDGLSGLTANPALGVVSDWLVSSGGTVALAEIPECHGAEGLLYQRSRSEAVRARLKSVFDWWESYAARHQVNLNNNLAPGNIQGGITTIIEKSLGAVAKGGSSTVNEVVEYAEPITQSGLVLMNTPGFDPVSVTGLVAGGSTLVAFTTGRGSVYGCAIAPTLKIATNSALFRRMSGDMDVDAGKAVEDGTLVPVAEALYRRVVEVASGRKTASEALGLGWEEFTPWLLAETL